MVSTGTKGSIPQGGQGEAHVRVVFIRRAGEIQGGAHRRIESHYALHRRQTMKTPHLFLGLVFAAQILLNATEARAGVVRYRLDVDNTWSEETHPERIAPTDAHFSWLGGGTHNDNVSFWQVGELASPGMVQMAETGVINILTDEEIQAEVGNRAFQTLEYRWWFCPAATMATSCGDLSVEFDVDDTFPLVTLVTMLGPSPDWFVGVSGLPLFENGQWKPSVVVDLHPFDGGTRSANQWPLGGPQNDPPEAISVITEPTGQLVGPAKMGTFTFTLLTPPSTAVENVTWGDVKISPDER